MTRKLSSWINTYVQHTKGMGSPNMFCKWTAVAIIAGVLERKVWVRTSKGDLYPNMYTLLIGEPGVGKTLQTHLSWTLWNHVSSESTDDHWLSPQSVTHASIIDELVTAERKLVRPNDTPPVVSFNSLLISVNELSVLLAAYDAPMMGKLTDIYDCKTYGESRRGSGARFSLPNPQLNLLAATTPGQLHGLLPEGAWEQGFLSRVNLIYSGELVEYNLWDDVQDVAGGDWAALENDIAHIGKIYGKMRFEQDAAEAIDAWQKAKGPPRPTHPKLTHYCTRRTAHLLKLCMVISMSYSDELIITMDHYIEALQLLLEGEKRMPDIFKAMTSGGLAQILRETWHFVYELYMKTKDPQPVREELIIRFLTNQTTEFGVPRIMDLLISGKILTRVEVNKIGPCYIPKSRKDF